MKQYINKAAVVAEIERRINEYNTPVDRLGSNNIRLHECKDILSFLNTIDTKEVDLEKEKDDYWNKLCDSEFGEFLERDAKWYDDIAKHFFELGLKAHNNNKVD